MRYGKTKSFGPSPESNVVITWVRSRPTYVVNRGSDAGLDDSFSHAARATGVAIMVSNWMGVKRPEAA